MILAIVPANIYEEKPFLISFRMISYYVFRYFLYPVLPIQVTNGSSAKGEMSMTGENIQSKVEWERRYGKSISRDKDVCFVVHAMDLFNVFISAISKSSSKPNVVDLGFGCGTLMCYMANKYDFIFSGVEGSPTACEKMRKINPCLNIVCGDVCNTGLMSESYDAVISTQVIEHVDDDRFLYEIKRILKKNGVLYITTVFKNAKAFYFYKNEQGERVLEPTHLREYTSLDNIFGLLKKHNLKIKSYELVPTRFPVIDLMFRCVSKLIHNVSWFEKILASRYISLARKKIKVRIPGYYFLEIFAESC